MRRERLEQSRIELLLIRRQGPAERTCGEILAELPELCRIAVGTRELAQMIFAPGFSTATNVTALAGRGVGMDVVRSEVSGIGGRIDIDSKAGKGTTITVHLPVSMAVSQVVLLGVDKSRFAVQAALVERILQVKPEDLAASYDAHQIRVDGENLPLFYLGSLLELSNVRPVAQRLSPVVVLRFEADSQAALERIQEAFKTALLGVWPGLTFSFDAGH